MNCRALGLIAALCCAATALGQASLTGTSYSETFDSMGTTGTTPPAGWKHLSFNMTTSNSTWTNATGIFASGTNSVASIAVGAAGTTLTATTTPAANNNNGFNAAASASTTADRVIATAPTSVTGSGIQLQLVNNRAAALNPGSTLTVAFDTVRFNSVSSANELPGYWVFASLDAGTTWTNVTPNATISTVPNTVGTTAGSLTLTLPAAWNTGASLYLRWIDDNAVQTSPDQIVGLNNVVITVATVADPNGRCCSTTTGACTLTTTGTCPAGSTFSSGGVCDPNTCPPPPSGTCCLPTGACTSTIQIDCPVGSVWTNGNTCVANPCPVLVAILPATGYSQPFDAALGASGTALPPGFSMWSVAGDRPTFEEIANGGTGLINAPAVGTATAVSGSLAVFNQSGVTAPGTRNAGYNFGFPADPADRLLGLSPTGNGASFIQLRLLNDTGSSVNTITFTYDFRVMSEWTANELAGYRFFYSTAGVSGPWTPVPALDGVATSTTPTGTRIAESAIIALASPIAPGADILFRWGDDNGNASPDQAYAIDNLSIIAGSGPVQICCLPDGSCVIQPANAPCAGNVDPVATACDPNPCPQPPSGRCCAIDGTCTFVRQSACVAGVWTVGGACSPNPCPGPVVACCLADGSCVSVPQDQCTAGFNAGPVACSTLALCRQPGVTRFVVFGDHGVDGSNQLAVANRLKRYNPAFIATTGDNTYFTNADITNYDRTQAKYYGQFIKLPAGSAFPPGAASNEFFPTMGNHDFDISGTAAGAIAYWNSYWDLPGNERYYTFTRGPIEFFMLSSDSREPDGDTVGSVQQLWFAQRAAASTAQFKLAFFHHPAYTYPSNHASDLAMRGWNFGAAGMNAVFSGHNHNLQRIEAEGIPFFVSGGGGNSLYSINGTVAGGAFASSSFGFHLVDATATQVTIRCIDVSGALLDTRVLTAPTGACCAADGSCQISVRTLCTANYLGDASVCNPNPCPQPTGACCQAAACTVVTAAQCAGPSDRFAGVGSVCNVAGNNVLPCCRADFNQSGVRDVSDIFAFLSAWFADSPQADLDGNGRNVQDIFSFLSLWFAGC